MINLAPIRAAIAAAPGKTLVITADQLEELLTEVDDGRAAKRELRLLSAIGTVLPDQPESPSA